MLMNKRYHNDEDRKYSELIRSLQDLPRVSAPDNFEMNLRRRINNLDARKERTAGLFPFNLRIALIPAAGLVAVVIALFYMLPYMDNQLPQTKQTASKQQVEKTVPKAETPAAKTLPENNIADKTPASKPVTAPKTKAPAEQTAKENNDNSGYASNEELRQMLRDFNLSGYGNDVDKSLKAKPNPNGGSYGNESQNVGFDNLNLAPQSDRVLEEMKARMDSIRKKMRGNR